MAFVKLRQEASKEATGLYDRGDDVAAIVREVEAVVTSGRLRIIELTGEAGLGKSRLLAEVRRAIDEKNATAASPVLVMSGRARAASSGVAAFQPFIDSVGDLAARLNTHDSRSQRAFAALRENAPLVLNAIPLIGPALQATATVAQHYAKSPQAEEAPEQTHRHLIRFFAALAHDQAVVLALDDMHWADPSSVDLLFDIAESLASLPILIVVSYRALDLARERESHPLAATLDRLRRYRLVSGRIELSRLDQTAVTNMVEDLIGLPPSRHVSEWLYDRTDGNPFYVEEFVALLSERQELDDCDGSVDVPLERLIEIDNEIPPTIESVIRQRFALIEHTEEFRCLQVASIIGEAFSRDSVITVSDLSPSAVDAALRDACQRFGLIEPFECDSYRFYHGLVHEFLEHKLRSADPLDYRTLHARCAAYLLTSPRADDLHWLQEVARHYHEAQRDDDALRYALKAAQLSERLGALNEAVLFGEWAVAHADKLVVPLDRVIARMTLGSIRQALEEVDEAQKTLEEAAMIAGEAELGGEARLELLVKLARARRKTNDWSAAREALERASALAPTADVANRSLIGLLTGEIALCGRPRSLASARQVLEATLALRPDDRTEISVCGHLALVYQALDDLKASDAAAEQAQRAAHRANHPAALYTAGIFCLHLHIARLALNDAEVVLDDISALASEHGIGYADVLRYQGRRAALAQDWAAAAVHYARFLLSDLRLAQHLPQSRDWVLTHVALQGYEVLDLNGKDSAQSFILQTAEQVARRHELQQIAPTLARDLARITDSLELPEGRRLLMKSPSAEDAFSFYIDDLLAFRQRHKFI